MNIILNLLIIALLIALSIYDIRTYEIPLWINISIFVIALIHLVLNRADWKAYVIGFFAVSVPLLLIYVATKGNGIGGGDIKLMAVAGLYVGWQNIILAFLLGCILGAVIHVLRMKISKEGRVLAFGPYLSAGIIISLIYGNQIIGWYIHTVIGI